MGKRSRRKGQPEPGEPEAVAPAGAEAADGDGADAAPAVRDPEAGEPPAPEGAATGTASGRQPIYDSRLREAISLTDEADFVYTLFRWTVLQGRVPSAADWLRREDMPHPDAVAEVFGSWAKFVEGSGVADSPLLARLREVDGRERDLEAREGRVEREAARAADLRRQLETARRKRDDAERERDEEGRRATLAERTLGAMQTRAERAEAALHERREAAQEVVAEAPEAAQAAADAATAELEAVRAHREQLLTELEQLREAAARDRRAIAELSAALGDRTQRDAATAAGAGEEDVPEDEPKSVLEAVRVAAATLPHLVFTESAFDSAADSPYRRPVEILADLRKLDGLAERFNAGQMGVSLGQAAQEAGLTWRAGVSELARTRYAKHYVVTHEGHALDLGPHIALGSGSGAGLIARIYLHVADGNGDVPRGVYVAHVGRHLPDTTT